MSHNIYFFVALLVVTASACVAFAEPKKSPETKIARPGLPIFGSDRGTANPVTDTPAYTVVPLTPGYEELTLSMARGGNAGYLHPDPQWRGGWFGQPGLP
jgi:hypothetical protein